MTTMKKLTLELDDSYYELKKPDEGMVWIGTCIYCGCDVAIERENRTTVKHFALDGKTECEWEVEPAELDREQVNENLRECKEAIRGCKRSIKEIKTHFGKSFSDRDLARSYPEELVNLDTAEKDLVIAQKVKDRIKGKTGKPEKRLWQSAAPNSGNGTCQFCLHVVPVGSDLISAQRHGFEDEFQDVEECIGGQEPVLEHSSDRINSNYRSAALEVLSREMALDRDLIDEENLVKFNRYLDRCRADRDGLLEPYRSNNKELLITPSITDGDIKARALEVSYKQTKSEDAIKRWPDMADFTYEAVRERKANLASVESELNSLSHTKSGSIKGWIVLIILLTLTIGYLYIRANE